MTVEAQFFHGEPVMVDHTPSGAVDAGDVIVTNDLVLIAHNDIAANELGALAIAGGVYKVTADGAIGAGRKVYWDNSANKVTLTAAGNNAFGWTVTASSNDGDEIVVYHMPTGDLGNQAAVVAALTDNGGGTADGTVAAMTVVTPATDGSMTGTANGALEIVGSTSGGDVSGAIMNNFKELQANITAIAAFETAAKDNFKEITTELAAILTALKNAGLMAAS